MTETNLTSTTEREQALEEKIAEVEEQIAHEETMIQRMMIVQKLRRLGYKLGACGYCGAKTEDLDDGGSLVYVKRLPNKISACYLCYTSRGASND